MDFRNGAWGGWNDASDGSAAVPGLVQGFIVEFAGALPEPGSLALAGLALVGASATRAPWL